MTPRADAENLVADAADAAPDEAATRFVAQFYAHVAPTAIAARTPDKLRADAISLWQWAAVRAPGTAKLRILAASPPARTPARTIVEIVNDDMPFLLDSVTMTIAGEGLTLLLAIHPILAVKRDRKGALVTLHEPGAAPAKTAHESMMQLEIAEAIDETGRARLQQLLEAVLAEVRVAVEDWPRMRAAIAATHAALVARPPRDAGESVAEASAFFQWLADDYFVFLGCRDYRFAAAAASGNIVPGSGLGILRDDGRSVFEGLRRFVDLPAATRVFLLAPRIIEVARSSERARIVRPAPMDAIAVKLFDAEGQPEGLRLFVGLLTWHAYRVNPLTVPILKAKVENVLRRSEAPAGSHDRRVLIHIIESLPRDELFQLEEDQLLTMALGIRDLEERPRVGLFIRRDPFGRFYTAFVFVPREHYRTELRERFVAILTSALDARLDTFHVALDDEALARVTFYLRTGPGSEATIDVGVIERRLAEATRSWSDGLREALEAAKGEDEAARLFFRYRLAFPVGYRARFAPGAALADIDLIERVTASAPFAIAFEPFAAESSRQLLFKLFRAEAPMPLSDILPLLEYLGLRVIEENPYDLAVPERPVAYQEFVVESLASGIDITRDRARLEQAFTEILAGDDEADGFSRLLVTAGLDGREVAVLRLYARFLRQAGASFSLDYMADALARHGAIAAKLVLLFRRRFDPARQDGVAETDRIGADIEADLDAVASLDDDRILRGFLTVLRHSLRTNFFQTEEGAPKPYLSVKFDSAGLADLLPPPRPMVEIFVSAPWMEGIHLRAGKIARGGIRWSDRREDFRTEILGLMKAQVVKNAVIVPTGSKGGFIVKRPPADRAAFQEEGIRCYETLLRGMLDITDNVVDGRIVPPADAVRHDGDDPYLVVAADKGTATFSDIANSLALARGYWLGDAFASGGSEGYDHKAMGITARGAWEEVERHFRELGTDIETTDFTVIGVGDMSGDVFGNGMLRARHIKLVAAFDHRHIFLDPEPDTEASFAERERLFHLPRSSWADYDPGKISVGGGVFPRGQKSIPLAPQLRIWLGVAATQLDPASLIRTLLKSKVDLIWFGGIGTFVKAASERNAEVGDRANDAVRVDGRDIRARVIGEGANLGATQLGRVEYALAGGRIDTDSIDNSAGVDTSDREVNIKIALDTLVRAGTLEAAARHRVLYGLTDEVATLVLADNDAQGLALSLAEAAKGERFEADLRLMRDLERQKILDRAVEFLPDDEAMAVRANAGIYLTRPELSILLSFAKNALVDLLMAGDFPDDAEAEPDLFRYFPPSLVATHRTAIAAHHLRREIIATVAANELVNIAGIAFVNEMTAESGRDASDVARAFAVVRAVFGLDRLWQEVESLGNRVPAQVRLEMLLESHRLTHLATGWLLRRQGRIDRAGTIAAARPRVAALAAHLPEIIEPVEREALVRREAALISANVPEKLARAVVTLTLLDPALAIADLALATGEDAAIVARRFFAVGVRLRLDALVAKLRAPPDASLWQQRAGASLVEEIYARQAVLTQLAPDDAALDRLLARRPAAADHYQGIADEIAATAAPDLARLLLACQALTALAAE
ncbi:MAG: NAD-glutamate dehydrogenase [Stellaceae bacterium]